MKSDERIKKADIVRRLKEKDAANPVALKELCWLLRSDGVAHSHGYFHYTTWERLRRMLTRKTVDNGEKHRFLFLFAASQMNDRHDAHNGVYLACFSFGEEEEVPMWTNYGVPKREAVRIRFPMAAVTKWMKDNPIGRVKIYVPVQEEEPLRLLDIKPATIEFVNVAYYGRNKSSDRAKKDTVRYRGESFALKEDRWRERIKGRHEALYFKKRGWAYENEVRLIVKFADGEAVKSYGKIALNFDLFFDAMLAECKKNVLLGPWWSMDDTKLTAIAGIMNPDHSVFEGELQMRSNCDLCEIRPKCCNCPNAEWRLWKKR